ncbi:MULTISPECIES: S1C family serine protease [unclassified Streptomyces]|uniref:S1C family serine protease n=1 Tax=unclassified Streptomyces TaxID=2593676 RepID=UPI0006AE982D|nr:MULTISPECIES: trypsin-like peptidase domain-containing protein [unclassified Streptomyces]KOX21658.1 serine protease [Streptomyces sp. NRRL F-6491]KOX42260.1 serine protease [Streptomyces sp. NRRL F-6492]
MTDHQEQPQQPYYPPRPPYEPARPPYGPFTEPIATPPSAAGPFTTEHGTTIWPSGGHGGHGGHVPSADPAPAATDAVPGPRRRAKRGVGLMAAVAIAAAAIGGGTATLVQRLTADPATVSAAAPVPGTNVAARGAGTVAGVAEAVSPSIVEISAASGSGKSTGSGVIITSDGEIVTNNHVVSGASEITVRLNDGRTHPAEVVGTDPDKDLALIKLKGASGLKAAALGNSKDVKVGDEVVAIGSPEGLTGTVTSGIVSALDRDVTVAKDEDQGQDQGQGQQQYDPRQGWPFEFGGQQFNGDTGSSKTTYKALQTDASLNPGNSGGALINMNGEIIGINSAMYSPSSSNGSTAGSVGLGFAIPVDTVKADLDGLRSGGDN